ncbi:hypothetical protein CLOACE_22970 [Clostridium acetireducens DSM 10703]|uniref:MEDS domain-containing protein n=1 Tax=Clostridium acetireducens DSM 10703 TaxID=1121290 RepID=A0A1E8EUH7_9CLOT|nr:hypothetical protein [Clostridium acetireducens]OFH96899.1 hypothetical protein CLOACE_22970 [Clostridium acetireducens DSM 10703]
MNFKCDVKDDKLLCISTEDIKFNNLPKVLKKFILEGLNNEYEVIVFTDDAICENLEKVSYEYKDLIYNSLRVKRLKFEIYNSLSFNENSLEFTELLNYINNSNFNIRVIWDFNSIVKSIGNIELIDKCIKKIFSCSNKNIKNLVYVKNMSYNFNLFKDFCKKFDKIFILDRYREINFSVNEEIEKVLWILQSNAQLEYKNSTLLLFE